MALVFLFDVDNTLLDNDRVTADLRRYLDHELGGERTARYFALFEELRRELGYADYLGALQRYRAEHPRDPHVLALSGFLVDYPFANRLYPGSLDAVEYAAGLGTTAILSDGDAVFQPRKVHRAGLFEAVGRNLMIYVHKELELDDVERRYPGDHYVMIDDKIRILTSLKAQWGDRVTTVFPRQGHYARAPEVANYPPADFTIERIGDLPELSPMDLTRARPASPADVVRAFADLHDQGVKSRDPDRSARWLAPDARVELPPHEIGLGPLTVDGDRAIGPCRAGTLTAEVHDRRITRVSCA